MPVTRITLRQGYSDAALRQLSGLLQQALVAEFSVPRQDCFQIIEMLPVAQRVFDRHYLSGGRSDDFVLFQITAGRPRSRQQKQQFYHALCTALQREMGIAPEDVMIVIQFNSTEEWSFSGDRMLAQEAL
ncbi:tautomerase family protein [Pantoea graminicola]|uniref:tautomerase family protein n=1 Tax=Pantoea sp. ARC607 TaxID=2027922 RepID=UPI000DAA5166|nr:tautomerase family protein [Pantoea sp. ARC607]PZL97713.1 tautomerase family protein [Pantoea sp. ARC607]